MNVFLIVVGLGVIAGCIALIKNRVAVLKFIVQQNTNMYGKWVGSRMARVSPTMGVVVPGVFGIVIGTVWVLVGIFVRPHG